MGVPTRTYDKARLASVIAAAAEAYGFAVSSMLAKTRVQPFREARHLAMYLARAHTTASYHVIARAMGLDHSTVIHGHAATAARLEHDAGLRAHLDFALALLAGHSGDALERCRRAAEAAEAEAYRRQIRARAESNQRCRRRAVLAAVRKAG